MELRGSCWSWLCWRVSSPGATPWPGWGKMSRSWATRLKTRRIRKRVIEMDKFTVLNGLVAPLDRANVDTDAIIPKQFLKSIKRSGFGPNAFDEWRYLDHGEPGVDNSKRPKNPDFVLNQPRYAGASILLTR